MVYPESPFTNKLNIETITFLNNGNTSADLEAYNLPELLQWLCTGPKITSFRVNTLIIDVQTIKKLLEDELKLVVDRQEKTDSADAPKHSIYTAIPKVVTHHLLHDVLLVGSYPGRTLDLNKRQHEIIVDVACGTAILRGANIFAPGVMAIFPVLGTKVGEKVSIYADISKKCKKGLAKIYDCPQKLFIANGIVKMNRKDLFRDGEPPIGLAVVITDSLSGCPAINEKHLPIGAVLLQNIPSIVCSHVLNPEQGETILDMCAAPGNKTSHLAALIKNQGTIIALDKTPNKLLALNKTCEQFHLQCVQTYCFDATQCCSTTAEELDKNVGPPFLPESFDKILLDAPCSGLGKRPQLLNTITDKVAKSYVPLQKKLIRNAVSLLKSGGCLVYSTCSITLGENEGIVSWTLNKFSNLELVSATPILGGPGWPGTNLREDQLNLVQRFGPNQDTDSIGFFIAKFRKM